MLQLLLLQLLDHPLLLAHLLVSERFDPARGVPERPAIPSWYRVVRDDGRVLFEHGGSVVTLEGRATEALLPTLLPLLDGTRTAEEIVEALGSPIAPAVANALESLAERGLLTEGPVVSAAHEACPLGTSAAFVAAGARRVPPAAALDALAAAEVAVAGQTTVGDELERLAREGGLSQVRRVSLAEPSAGRDLLVCAPAPAEVDELRGVNQARLSNGGPWLPVLPHDGRSLVIGPLVLPNQSACQTCYRLRRASASGYEEDFDLVDRTPTRAAGPAALRAVASGLAATVTLRWLTVRDATLPGRCYVLETGPVLALSFHQVLRVPRCPDCGPRDTSIPSPWFKETARDG